MEYQILFIYIYMYGDVWQLEERNFNQTEVDGIKIISGFV